MTTDGFIDINHLLDLKLMADLVTNRDVLLEAISRSKLLKMNTGCTMVKYMPILERNILILRDIPDKTMKEEIMTIFDNEHCSLPREVHSDIGNHWFCQFNTEEECLATAQYLNSHGNFKGEKLHVRVKAIHDKNKADTSPQMQNAGSSKSKSKRPNAHPPPQPYGPSMPYSPGQWYAYYGTGAVTADYGFSSAAYPPKNTRNSRSSRRDRSQRSPPATDQSKANGVPSVTPPLSGGAPAPVVEPMTASSDYPGQFDKYSMATFLEIFQTMEEKGDLDLPQSMRGRDVRIISDEVMLPVAVAPMEDTKDLDEDGGGRGRRRRKRGRGRGRGRKKKEMRGYYYEDEALERNGQVFYDQDYPPPYYPENEEEAYHYRDEYGDHGDYGYYEEDDAEQHRGGRNGRGGPARGRRRRRRRGRGQQPEEEEEEESEQRRGGRRGGSRRRSARQYNSRRRPEKESPEADMQSGRKKKKPKARRPKEVWAPKGSKSQEK